MKRVKKILTPLALIALLSGCGTELNLSKFTYTPMEKSPNMPSKEVMLNQTLPKVIIMDLDNNSISIARESSLGKSIASSINSQLSNSKVVNVLKRVKSSSYDKMLESEIKAAELAKEIGDDVGQADYIITGKISNASYNYNFYEGYYYEVKTKEGKKRVYQPPVIRYKACTTADIKIFSLPDLSQAESIPFNSCARNSHEARSIRYAKKEDDGLVRSSANSGVNSAKYSMMNFFAKRGYIYEMRKNGDKIVVKTTLGKSNGAKEGESVEIYSIESVYNHLLEKESKEIVKIGEGKISNQVRADSSWIIVDEIEEGKRVKAGDFIKIKYSGSFWSSGLNILTNTLTGAL